MHLSERFSNHLKNVLVKAIQLATELKQKEVRPVHLLFSLFKEKGSLAHEILDKAKLQENLLENKILSIPSEDGKNPGQIPSQTTAQTSLSPLSPSAKTVLEKAFLIAAENNHNFLGTEHLLSALLQANDGDISEILQQSKISITDIESQLKNILVGTSQFPQMDEISQTMDKISENFESDIPLPPEIMPKQNKKSMGQKQESALDFFATELTNPEIQKNIDPVIGREKELDRLIQIICRRNKNNPILLGDPGVGKTAIVEGLAKKITQGDVPEIIKYKKIYALDMGLLIAGTMYRGEFESRLRQVIEETLQNPNIILFIDELHNIVGAGSSQGTMDAANILKPALARGQIRCIGSTTGAEFKKFIESDAALERRFQPIIVREPSPEETIKILNGLKKNYEKYHQVKISDKAIVSAVNLANRYINDKFLPDKAIDLIDETASAKRLSFGADPKQSRLWQLRKKLNKITFDKEKAALDNDFGLAMTMKEDEIKIAHEIKNLEREITQQKEKYLGTVTEKDVLQTIAKIINTQPNELILDNRDRFAKIKENLKKRLVGQDGIIENIVKTIEKSQLGLTDPQKPLASFLFVGVSGTGKTELAKLLAQNLYPGSEALIKLDMSEFNESFGVSKLLGSPAGYVGYKEANQFTDRIKMNPYCIVLFDEIDKAHRDVTKLLLQMLENGSITDSTGKKISLKHAIIILTTSLFADELQKGAVGFGDTKEKGFDAQNKLSEKLKERFSPEFINRLDKICLFNQLDKKHLEKIARLEIELFNERLKNYKTKITAPEKTLSWVIDQLKPQNQNARELKTLIENQVEELMTEIILKGKIKKQYSLKLQKEKLIVI
ncbi:MAG TPA: ATP-dependent Clp protease ATP-binding subunit [Candidatus Magasanikbacteria bacterium]|nr:ATP-dependent Clp protease ATP-binding subunit [Candidatus Magasanikbacteria bacterium]